MTACLSCLQPFSASRVPCCTDIERGGTDCAGCCRRHAEIDSSELPTCCGGTNDAKPCAASALDCIPPDGVADEKSRSAALVFAACVAGALAVLGICAVAHYGFGWF